MSKRSRSVQNQLFWITTRYLLPGNVVSEVDAVSGNVSIFTCVKMPLICISMEQSTLFCTHGITRQIIWMDISRILQTAFKSHLRAAWFAVPFGCGGGKAAPCQWSPYSQGFTVWNFITRKLSDIIFGHEPYGYYLLLLLVSWAR